MLQEMIRRIDFKKLTIIPMAMLLLSMFIVFSSYNSGTIPMSIELKGGTLLTVYKVPRGAELENALLNKFNMKFKVGAIKDISGVELGRTIETNKYLEVDEMENVKNFLISWGATPEDISIRSVGPSISARFLKEAVTAVLFAFSFMAGVIFLRFRTPVSSAAVVLSAFSDIVTTFAVMILTGIELSPGTFVALLLLIGYSVDTDILLTARLLAAKGGTFEDRLYGALKTGLTMMVTTLSAVVVLLLVATSAVLREIAVVIFIGLLVDVVNTWIQNAGILHWYIAKGGK